MPCTPRPRGSMFVLMVETLGEAYRLGWRATACCIWSGPNPKSRHGRTRTQCDTTAELDIEDVDLDAWGELPAQAP
jgi:hypothetical protein